MSEEKKLTLKQAKWLDIYIKTGNATEAAMQSYDCKDRDSARALGAENLSKLNIGDLMEELGLTSQKIILRHSEALDASKIVTSPTEPDKIVPDYQTRLKAAELAYKVKGMMPKESPVGGNIFNFIKNEKNEFNL